MISRPKSTDTMNDIRKMQNDYIKDSSEHSNFEPAAKAIKVNNESISKTDKKTSIFAQQRKLRVVKDEREKQNTEVNVLNDIIERRYDKMDDDDNKVQSFPNTHKIIPGEKHEKASIFLQSVTSSTVSDQSQNEKLNDIHKIIDDENSKLLQSMSMEQIKNERDKLLKSLDPGTINFLKNKRKNQDHESIPSKEPKISEPVYDFSQLEILKDENFNNWLNMNLIEPEKLEWTKDIEYNHIKSPQKFEARFDWKGFLQPYTFQQDSSMKDDDRHLYVHGDEQHRPGYTLQELFRLARANVLQQRISAISAISGILNIYSQGYYDDVVQLPISKIFFFLRFALDENIPAVIQSSLKGLSYMFYNETDEALLDVTYETHFGYLQPSIKSQGNKNSDEELEQTFKHLNLEDRNIFSCNTERTDNLDIIEGNDMKNINDFHLAETNLVDCLLRTNIIERITYILLITRGNQSIYECCIKILIRMARESQENTLVILHKQNLVRALIIDEKFQEIRYLIIKLFRVIASNDRSNLLKLENFGVLDMVTNFISLKDDMNIKMIKLQIECCRFLRLYFLISPNESKYNTLILPIRYLLEWHYQFLEFEGNNHFIVRTHASSLLCLLGCSNVTVTFPIFGEILKMCCSKFYYMANRDGVNDFSQKILLQSLLDVASKFIKFGPEYFYDFINDYFIKFLKSKHYVKIENSLLSSSLLFKNTQDRSNIQKSLQNLGSVIRREIKASPILVLSQDHTAHFIESVLMFINSFNNQNCAKNIEYYRKLLSIFTKSGMIKNYLTEFCSLKKRLSLSTNWFARIEIELIFNLLITRYENDDNSSYIFQLAFNLLYYLSAQQFQIALTLFEKFIFNEKFYDGIAKNELEKWKFVYNGVVMSKIKNGKYNCAAVIHNWNQSLLENSWTYSLLLFLLYKVDIINTDTKRIVEIDLKEIDIIKISLQFNKQLHRKIINITSPDEKLMFLMLIYFGADLDFLDKDVKEIIKEEIDALKNTSFNFESKLNHEKSFESLYIMFIETFQANGYGDNLFSSLVMIPLSQKYDVKWRKLVWSEYAMILKFIKCTDTELLCDINEYLYPIENDESLLKSYMSALKSNHLNKNSIPWKIANHHVKNYILLQQNQS